VKNFRLEKQYVGIPIQSDEGDFDYKRAKEGGLTSPFMSIYIPSSVEGNNTKLLADSLINMVTWIATENKAYFEIAKTPNEVEKIFKSGRIALPMGMENGSPIRALSDIDYFKTKGISYITLTHSKVNQISDSSYDTIRRWDGLSEYGERVVKRMNAKGVMVDVSHISDSAFYDVIKITKTPVIASHSSARHFTPGLERNLSDDQIVAIRKNGGVIMVNFGTLFLDSEMTKINRENEKKINDELKRRNISEESIEGKKFIEEYRRKNPKLYPDVEKVADHIDYIVSLAGIESVGLGSDYDGVGDSLPIGLKDVSDYPNLIAELLKRKYSEEDIAKICYKNLFRVWNKVIEYSNTYGGK
jgi:membrane dipeptidase